MNETDERFVIGESTIPGAGRGVFACCPLAVGDRLTVTGVLVPAGSLSDQCTAYADEYKLRAGTCLLIPLGHGALVNHSDTPNLVKVVEGEHVYLQALRPVRAGEELFFAYSDYARQRWGVGGRAS